jgi:taurine---2-oxoglutarate transaminase
MMLDTNSVVVDADPEAGARVRSDDRGHVFHSWSAQGQINPLPVAGALGCWFWDYDGTRYLDFSSQLMNVSIGHQHPRVVAAIKEQADRLCTIGPSMANDKRGELARLLSEIAGGDLDMAFFTNGGAEANENAIRIARLFTGRHKIMAAYRSYHGATAGAITLTGDPRRWPSEPGISGVVRFNGPYTYRSSFHAADDAQECARALQHVEEVLMFEGAHTVAAIIVEPIVGTNGILVPPDGYLAGLRAICDRHGILLICDEVMAGFGRAGAWFAHQLWDVRPDLISCAKGINSGYVPLGALIISRRIADAFRDRPFPGGLTYSGHPLACASAVASISAFRDEGIVDNARRIGEEVFAPELGALVERHPSVGEVRGRGCFWGVELVTSKSTREMLVPFNASGPDAALVGALTKAALARGLSLFIHWNVIVVAPPLVITPDEARHGVAILDDILAIADEAANSVTA